MTGREILKGKLEAAHLAGIGRVYVIREPEDGGTTFVNGVTKRLFEIGWTGNANQVVLHYAKDPNELHKQKPDGFKEAFQLALDNAERLPGIPLESGQDRINEILDRPQLRTSSLRWLPLRR